MEFKEGNFYRLEADIERLNCKAGDVILIEKAYQIASGAKHMMF